MFNTICIIFLAIFLNSGFIDGLECYTGFSIIRGKTVGTETKTCSSPSDKCYRANADISTLTKFKLAGCSTYRCMLSPNGCMTQTLAGQSIELCCCSGNLCNAPESNSESIAKGLLTRFSGNNNNGGGETNMNEGSRSSSNNGLLDTIKSSILG